MGQPTSPCQGCHAGCCRSFAIPITGADVLRVEQETGLDFWRFACRWEDRQGRIAGDFAPHLYFDDEPFTPFTLCLLHEASAIFHATSRCCFLEESPPEENHPLGKGRCGIYEHRPSACRVFPISLQKSSQLVVLDEIPQHGRPAESSAAYCLCPRPWQPTDIDPISGPQQVAVARYEAEFFKVVAEQWNRRPGAWLRFPEFLRLVYSQRVVRSAPDQSESEDPTTLPMIEDSPLRHAA